MPPSSIYAYTAYIQAAMLARGCRRAGYIVHAKPLVLEAITDSSIHLMLTRFLAYLSRRMPQACLRAATSLLQTQRQALLPAKHASNK